MDLDLPLRSGTGDSATGSSDDRLGRGAMDAPRPLRPRLPARSAPRSGELCSDEVSARDSDAARLALRADLDLDLLGDVCPRGELWPEGVLRRPPGGVPCPHAASSGQEARLMNPLDDGPRRGSSLLSASIEEETVTLRQRLPPAATPPHWPAAVGLGPMASCDGAPVGRDPLPFFLALWSSSTQHSGQAFAARTIQKERHKEGDNKNRQ